MRPTITAIDHYAPAIQSRLHEPLHVFALVQSAHPRRRRRHPHTKRLKRLVYERIVRHNSLLVAGEPSLHHFHVAVSRRHCSLVSLRSLVGLLIRYPAHPLIFEPPLNRRLHEVYAVHVGLVVHLAKLVIIVTVAQSLKTTSARATRVPCLSAPADSLPTHASTPSRIAGRTRTFRSVYPG